MAYFVISTDKEMVNDSSNSNFIFKSGMYDIIIKAVITETSANGSQYLDLWFEHEGQDQMIYSAMRITNTDGSVNFGSRIFNELAIILGGNGGQEINDPVERTLPIGKGGEMKTVMVLEEFENFPVTMKVQMQYKLYDGKIKESKLVRKFFRLEDKATASEICNNDGDFGTQYQKELPSVETDERKDGLTPEDVSEWIKNGRGRDNNSEKETTTKPSTGFGVKRQFGKKN